MGNADTDAKILDLLDRGLNQVSDVAHQVPPQAWSNQSPCEDWTAREVLGHLIAVVDIGLDIMDGKQVDPKRAGPPVGDDPAAQWDEIAARMRTAVDGIDLTKELDSPKGKRSAAEGLTFPTIDFFMHSWDIGTAAGIDVTIPDDAIEFAEQMFAGLPPEQMRGPGKPFGEQKPAPEGADATARLVAFSGRAV